jgi:phosphonate transport system substrate-binding protein
MRLTLLILSVLAWALPARAGEITIGLIPEQNVFRQMQRYTPLGHYVEQKTGIKVHFTLLSRYGNIIDRFREEKMDGAFWGSFTGGLAIKKLGIEPLARPVWKDGTSTYRGFIFVRRDSGIRNVSDMRGKVIAFVERATTAGWLLPGVLLHGQP